MFLGGSLNHDSYDTNPNEDVCNKIIEECTKIMPSLKVFRFRIKYLLFLF